MPLWIFLVFAALFGAVLFAIAFGLKFVEGQRKRQVSGMIQTVSGVVEAPEPSSILRSTDDDSLSQSVKSLPFAGKWERLLKQAGSTWSVQQLLLVISVAAVVGCLVGFKLRVLINPVLSAAALGAIFGFVPYLRVRKMRAKRLKEFEAQFPDALDFLARSMRAGHAFSVSLEMLADEMGDPLAFEFRQVYNEQNLGMSVDTALQNLQVRVPSVDVGFFVSAVMLQKETGGNLAEILTKLAYIIRERFRLKLKVRAASAHGRLTGAILSIMPLVLLAALTVLVPDYIPTMVNDPIGRYLVIAAIISQFLGYLCIRKIINIKV
jgi:tight adherence protein B